MVAGARRVGLYMSEIVDILEQSGSMIYIYV